MGLVLIASSCAYGQNTNGVGAPQGTCTGPQTYTNVTAVPPQAYSCGGSDGHTWVANGGGGGSQMLPFAVDAEWPFNDGTGTTISDISGNGHNATFGAGAAAPSWASYGVLFNVEYPLSATPQLATTNITSFKSLMIAYCVDPSAQTTGTGGTNGPYANFPSLFGSTTNDGLALNGQGSGSNRNSAVFQAQLYNVTGGSTVSSTYDSFGQCHTLAVTLGASDAYYVDGVPVATSVGSSISHVVSAGGYEFGANYFGSFSGFSGSINYALLSVGTVWTANQAQQLNAYVQTKLAARPMPVYPTFNRVIGNQLIFAGDSLWASHNASAVWTTKLTLNNTYTVDNWGFVGMNVTDICGLSESRWESSVAPGAPKNYAVFEGGINDIGATGTAAAIWAAISSCAAKARAIHVIPIASTIISATGKDASVAPVNALIRAGWKQAGFAALLDNAEDPVFAAGASTNTTYYEVDGLHLTGLTTCDLTTGYGHFCVNASKIINTLDGSTEVNPDATASNAFVPTDANNFVIQTPTAAATYTLVPCQAITGQSKTIVNGSTSNAITVSPTSPDTIVGSATISGGVAASYTAINSSPTAGGCYWLRTR
jgi:hypothetical protein